MLRAICLVNPLDAPELMVGDPLKNLGAFEEVVRAMKDAGVGYGSINHPVDRDPVCGFTGIIENECPHCKRNADEKESGSERINRIKVD